MNSKKSILSFLLCLTIIIAAMTWRELNPTQPDILSSRKVVSGYYAGHAATPVMVPDDNLPILIAQGRFNYDTGKTGYDPAGGMEPFTLAQRQVNLLFTLDTLPTDAAATYDQIRAVIKSWQLEGTLISAVVFDHRPETPDFAAYAAFIENFRTYFTQDPHTVIPVAEERWLTPDMSAGHQKLADVTQVFLYPVTGNRLEEPALDTLTKAGKPFLLIIPADANTDKNDNYTLLHNPFFAGAFQTLDRDIPLKKNEHKIGVWPKTFHGE